MITIDGEPWWVAADICAVLGVKNTSDAVTSLDEDEKQQVNSNLVSNEGGGDP